MKTASLDALTTKVVSWNPSRLGQDEFAYIDLGSVSSETKLISKVARIRGAEAPSRARQLLQTGDVLVSTVRPNLNAVAQVPARLDGATGSTGFTVLRPTERLDARYLFHWVQTRPFVMDMVRRATGASYPAVSDKIVKESMIPLPPLAEQRRIASILDQADLLRVKRRQVLEHLQGLQQSVFVQLFGDPSSWSDRWTLGSVGDLVESTQYGSSAKASNVGEWPVLRMGNVTDDGRLDLHDLKYLDLATTDLPKYTVQRGDLLFNRTNSLEKVGKSCVVETARPLAFAGYLVRIRFVNPLAAYFVSAYLGSRHGRAVRRGLAKTAVNQANINPTELKSVPIALPPQDRIDAFAVQMKLIGKHRTLIERDLAVADELLESLQSHAFRGEL
ncbi:restriction endonuclease subunit S [Curtobacterium sp. 18060]|uniref:restriction endonuclease subunit S n=1 Tax=Curtobacterium sp. 18060 TaxID=2681408 RepID=UPI0013567958|nr:restriction endonuclease subunit S [Curtobacterium sp. 18060]